MFGKLVFYYRGILIDGIETISDICQFLDMVKCYKVDIDIMVMQLILNHQYSEEDENGRFVDIFYVSPS